MNPTGYMVMVYIVMACIVMAYIVMALRKRKELQDSMWDAGFLKRSFEFFDGNKCLGSNGRARCDRQYLPACAYRHHPRRARFFLISRRMPTADAEGLCRSEGT